MKNLILLLIIFSVGAITLPAQTTAFTYQGHLTDGGASANGNYDIQFTLKNALTAGSTVGSPQAVSPVQAVNGIFNVTLDFGGAVFDGSDRFVELAVRPAGSPNPYTVLAPRQRLTATPYAMRSVSAGSASTATTATNATNLTGTLTGANVPAQFITSSMIANGAVGSTQLGAGAVQSGNIASGAVGTTQLATGAVTSPKLSLGYQSGDIFDGALGGFPGPTVTFAVNYTVPFATTPTVSITPAGWTLNSSGVSGFSASIAFSAATVDGLPGERGHDPSLALVDGFPAISYFDNTNLDLVYVRALNAEGTAWGTPMTIDSVGPVGQTPCLAVVDGRPAIAYFANGVGDLRYVRANDATGVSWGAPVVVDGAAAVVGRSASLLVVNGNPAISYFDDTNDDLKYVRATNATGSAWGSAITLDATGNVGSKTSLAIIGGNPAIAYADATNSDLKYIRATEATGSAWGAPVVVDSAGNVGDDCSLLEVNGRPAITYQDGSFGRLLYIRAADAAGTTWGTRVQLSPALATARAQALMMLDSRPAIALMADNDMKLALADDANGSAWSTILTMDAGNVNFHTAGAVINGTAAFAFYDETLQDLKYVAFPKASWRASDGTVAPLIAAGVPDGSIGSAQLATGAVLATNLADGAVVTTKLAQNAVTGAKLGLGSEVGGAEGGTMSVSSGSLNFTHLFDYEFASAPSVSLLTPGWTLGAVTSTGFTASIAFTPVTVDSAGSVGTDTSLAQIGGNPAISYRDVANNDLKYVRALDSTGGAWGTPVTVDSVGSVGSFTSLAVVNGSPAISYYDGVNGDLKYVRATDSTGTTWGTPVLIDTTGVVGDYTSLLVVNGNPAIAYRDSSNGDLKYVRASDVDGTAWGTPVIVDTSATVGEHASMKLVNGSPAISYYNASSGDLKYVRALDLNGAIWGTPITVDSTGVVGRDTSLAVVNGHPAISYLDTTNGNLKYVRANNADGTVWGLKLTLDSVGNTGFESSLAVINGAPAIAYRDLTNNDLRFIRATDASGDTWGAPGILDGATNLVGAECSLAVISGSPAVSYFDLSNSDLKYVRINTGLSWHASDGSIAPLTAAGVQSGAVGSAQLAANAVQGTNIAAGAVGSAQIATGAITNTQLAANAVQSANIAAGAIGSSQLAAGAVGFSAFAKPMQSGTLSGTGLDFSFGYVPFTVTFPQAFTGTIPVVTASVSSSSSPDMTVSVSDPSLTGFHGTVFCPEAGPHRVVLDSTGTVGQHTSMALIGGQPGIAYYDATNGNLKFVRSNDTIGDAWGAPVTADNSASNVGLFTSLAQVSGTPAISYYDTTNDDLKYVRATSSAGTAWNAPVTVDSVGDVGQFSSMVIANGNPAIAYYDVTNGDLKFVRATDATGTAWGAPVTVQSFGNVGQFLSLAIVSGNPAISYLSDTPLGDLMYVRATNPSGTAWAAPVVVDGAPFLNVTTPTSLKVVNGNPAIGYSSDGVVVLFVRAGDTTGATWGSKLFLDSAGDSGQNCSLAAVNGKPALSYYDSDNKNLRYLRARDTSGADWGTGSGIIVDGAGDTGQFTSLLDLGGVPGICYFDVTNGDLRFVRQVDPTVSFILNWIALQP